MAYSPGQVAGRPDADRSRHLTTAWTPREANSGEEWLHLEYARAVDIREVKVYERANSGAIWKVTAVQPDGSEIVLSDNPQPARVKNPAAIWSYAFNVSKATAACVRVYFDTKLAPGRIAIDTVQLSGRDGSTQWPVRAQASSFYDGGAEGRLP